MRIMQTLSIFKPLGVDLFCLGKKFLVFNLVTRNLKIKYHRSILGLLWTLLNPLALTFIYYFVFKVILNVKIPHYLPFILSGVLPWAFFSQTLVEGMESIVNNFHIMTKVPVPIQVFPLVGTLTNLITLMLALPILFGVAFFNGVHLGPSAILVILYFLALFLMTYGLSSVFAILFVYFRDLKHILGIILQLWFYATPVLYQESMIPGKYQWILAWNPVAYFFVDLHTILTHGQWPPLHNTLIFCGWTLGVMTLTLFIQKSWGKNLMEQV